MSLPTKTKRKIEVGFLAILIVVVWVGVFSSNNYFQISFPVGVAATIGIFWIAKGVFKKNSSEDAKSKIVNLKS